MSQAPCDLVCIGCSAGGIEALSAILPALPADFGAAVAVVLHVSPDAGTILPALFGAKCALPVKEAEDKEPIRPGVIYMAPPNYHVLVESDQSFALSVDELINFSRPSIDPLFQSAALAYRERVLAIVLTGANGDGANGLREVVASGGKAWVENPRTAKHPTMPEQARLAAPLAEVLSLAEIRDRLPLVNSLRARPAARSAEIGTNPAGGPEA